MTQVENDLVTLFDVAWQTDDLFNYAMDVQDFLIDRADDISAVNPRLYNYLDNEVYLPEFAADLGLVSPEEWLKKYQKIVHKAKALIKE
jgi:hypothetical protein